jgi:hypothetical protein
MFGDMNKDLKKCQKYMNDSKHLKFAFVSFFSVFLLFFKIVFGFIAMPKNDFLKIFSKRNFNIFGPTQ